MSRFRALPIVLVAVVLSACSGYVYVALTGGRSHLAGVIYASCIGCTVSAFDRGIILSRLGGRIRRWPSLAYILAAEAVTLVLVILAFAVAGVVVWGLDLNGDTFRDSTIPSLQITLYALTVAAVLIFVARMRDLLGHDVFVNLLVGRYHQPVEERRIFLFLDVVGSTAYARAHGDLMMQDYLGSIFAALAEPVRLHRGAIDDYIGDMAMITWPEARGVQQARCIRCVFAVLDEIERNAATWIARFGQVPRFRAALHGGPIVAAEVGIDRHKISYFGDVVNTTARIEALSGQLGASILISAELLDRVGELPESIAATSRGEHILKGRDAALEVFSLARRTSSNAQSEPLRDAKVAI